KNQDIIDEISNRYFYVEDPISMYIDNITEKEYIAEPLLHPTEPKKGKRMIKCKIKNNQLKVFISLSDAKKIEKNQVIRLKDLINIKIISIDLKKNTIFASYHSKELDRELSIIHWVPKDENIDVSILNPDGTLSKGKGELNLLEIPMNQTVQFERFGFVNPIKCEDDHLYCYFTH
ncbi:MAG: hypothetical protein ACFFE5_13595, partial [Candidatus Thorarchaeota archaeon]